MTEEEKTLALCALKLEGDTKKVVLEIVSEIFQNPLYTPQWLHTPAFSSAMHALSNTSEFRQAISTAVAALCANDSTFRAQLARALVYDPNGRQVMRTEAEAAIREADIRRRNGDGEEAPGL